MCGIAGFMTLDGSEPPAHAIASMLQAFAHRGPDGQGLFSAPGLTIAHNRLSIIDLETGEQPIHGPGGTVLVCNGEIYNYVELRAQLSGVSFRTHSDCEPPLHLYRAHGLDFVRYLRGMYAMAIWDPSTESLVLARDPFGIKPLYYAETTEGLIFASEAQAILATGCVDRTVRHDGVCQLLQLQFTTGRETVFSGIKRVAPGEVLVVKKGRIVSRALEPALPMRAPERIGEDAALKRLDAALMDSVMVHQRADVPYGMFFSGGVDSSALLACMARLNEKPVRAYTAGFPGTAARDERAHAREVAQSVGAVHIEVEVGAHHFWDWLPRIVATMDDPAADYAVIPTYVLAHEAAKDLKVVLCGEGGDEIFAGYGRYRRALRPWWLGGKPLRSKGLLDGRGVLNGTCGDWRRDVASVERSFANMPWSGLQRLQALDCADWLPNDLLTKLDRCLMAHSLEGRTPLLDRAVTQAAFCLPDSLKIRRGVGKYLLRKWLDHALPVAGAFTRKRGFTVPVADWMAPRAAQLGPLVARVDGVRALCVPGGVERVFSGLSTSEGREGGSVAWSLLFLALWHRIHVEQVPSDGCVFSVLEHH